VLEDHPDLMNQRSIDDRRTVGIAHNINPIRTWQTSG
jgi:hypothetical protein